MIEITSAKQLLDPRGRLATAGYAKHMNFIYDKASVKCPPLRLKEWDFYQVHFDERYVLQLTVGHASYASQFGATIVDLATGSCHRANTFTARNASFIRNMPTNPEVPHVLQYFGKNAVLQFELTDKYRRLCMTLTDTVGIKAEVDLLLTNVSNSKEKMVIATPFADTRKWCLNYKENCFVVNGYCRVEDVSYSIKDGFGLLDWGRGYWPYHYVWMWGNGGTVVNGKHFGFNIGWGFGNTEAATENMFFYDNKSYKLGIVTEINMGDTYRYVDLDKRFVFSVEPIYDYFSSMNVLWVHNRSHQLFGKWSGYVILDDGEKVEIPPFVAFFEKAERNW